MKRFGVMIGQLLLLAIFVATTWYLASPLFINRTVNEALPFELPLPILATATPTTQFPSDEEIGVIMPPTVAITTTESVTATERVTITEGITATPTVTGTAMPTYTTATITETVAAEAPLTTPIVVGQGNFVDGDAIHKGSGIATLYQTPDGSYLLRFDDFATTNGPDVHVLFSPNATPTDHDSLGEYLDLGEIKGNIGDQNYPLPAGFDPANYKSVVIHCLAFQVIFATATLQ